MKDLSLEFRILQITRENTINLLKPYSIEQLNVIPEGFSNNLIWNFAHIIVTQQLLCYGLSKNIMYTDADMVVAYRKGSKPEGFVSEADYKTFLELAEHTTHQIEKDYKSGLFKEYKTYTTSYNMTLNNVEEAIQFNNVHEGMHLGTCLAIRKFL